MIVEIHTFYPEGIESLLGALGRDPRVSMVVRLDEE